MEIEFENRYEIDRTAEYIHTRNFTIVALQFPDELLKDSTKVVRALRDKLRALELCDDGESISEKRKNVGLYVMADTTYGSCCVDEVGAAHINAQCVIHYGHTCLSPTSTLPAFLVFGKASISVVDAVEKICTSTLGHVKPVLVLFGLEYTHAMEVIKELLEAESLKLSGHTSKFDVHCADALCSTLDPCNGPISSNGQVEVGDNHSSSCETGDTKDHTSYSIGGLTWNLPYGRKTEDYLVFWIGSDNSAFASLVLTFNGCEIVRYDPVESCLVSDVSQTTRILKRRYYLVEKAKDANIVGIVVGTLGVAGYLNMIHQMKQLVSKAGKKAYTLVVGRPNPAKLANFPECEVFVYISCPQTALLDSKEYLAPVITPFEAMLAFSRGSQWTGAYTMEFRDLINSPLFEPQNEVEEPRFSFFQGGYVEEQDRKENANNSDEDLALAVTTDKTLRIRNANPISVAKITPKSGPEFLATRSYQGLDVNHDGPTPKPFLVGKSGRAAGYDQEKNMKVESV